MSPRAADEKVRRALIETAARLLDEEGRNALTTRRIAAEVGTSTMAVYTRFEDMDDLRRAVRLEGFRRLARHVGAVGRTADPVADLAAQGWAYCFSAVENEHMFRAMFVDRLAYPPDAALGIETFQLLVDSVQRCMDEGRLHAGDALARARQIWMMTNGVIVAHLAGFITIDDVIDNVRAMAWSLLTSFGDDPEAARRSLERARRRMKRRMKFPSRGTRTARAAGVPD
jgi:AcrR family transcriptional regulator